MKSRRSTLTFAFRMAQGQPKRDENGRPIEKNGHVVRQPIQTLLSSRAFEKALRSMPQQIDIKRLTDRQLRSLVKTGKPPRPRRPRA